MSTEKSYLEEKAEQAQNLLVVGMVFFLAYQIIAAIFRAVRWAFLSPIARKIFAGSVLLVVAARATELLHNWVSTSPWYVSAGTFGAISISAFLIIWWRKKEQAKRDTKEDLIVERIVSDAEFAADWLQNLHVHYYDPEKATFLRWLMSDPRLSTFRFWNDALRLQRMGEVTGKFYICHLDYMTEEQQAAKRQAAWDKVRREQSMRQKKYNAEQKAARRATNLDIDARKQT